MKKKINLTALFIAAALTVGIVACQEKEVITPVKTEGVVSANAKGVGSENTNASGSQFTWSGFNSLGYRISTCGVTFNGGLKATISWVPLSSSNLAMNCFNVELRKSDNTKFTTSGMAKVKAVSLCGTVAGTAPYYANTYLTNVKIYATMGVGQTVQFYSCTIPNSGGYYSNSGSVSIRKNY